MLENAARICEAKFGNVYLWDGDAFHLGLPPIILHPLSPKAAARAVFVQIQVIHSGA